MDIWYILMIPFTWLLKAFYALFNNYGIAIILFSLAIKIILFPLSLKGKRGMIQMNMLNGKTQKLQKMYANNQEKYNQELQKLYEKEGVNPMGGCLWSFVPLLILFPIYAVVRRPLKYWMGLGEEVIKLVTEAVKGTGLELSAGYGEIETVSRFFKDQNLLATAQTAAPGAELYGLNFNFLGIDLAATPNLKFWEGGVTWSAVGLLIIVVLCAVTSLLSSIIMNKTNQANSPNAQASQQNKMMMWVSPLMMLWFGFVMPGAMGIYIISNSVFTVIQEIIAGKLLQKDYEKARIEQERRAQEEKEEEKRLKEEARQERARRLEEQKKSGKGKKKSQQKKEDAAPGVNKDASRVGLRAYARGRAYDPYRFSPDGPTPYKDPAFAVDDAAVEQALEERAEAAEKAEFAEKYRLTEEDMRELEQELPGEAESSLEDGSDGEDAPEENGEEQ